MAVLDKEADIGLSGPTIVYLCVICPSEIFVNFDFFKHIHAATFTHSVDNLFH